MKAQTCCLRCDCHPALITILGCFQMSRKCSSFGWCQWTRLTPEEHRGEAGEQPSSPVPPELSAPVLPAGQGPNPAPQPATELALHPCIHSNSPVLLENWERRGQKRSTPEPFGQPAQGQELPDVGPHQELPQALLQTGRKALYQASAEGFYTKNSHPSNLSYHPPHCESASDLKQ